MKVKDSERRLDLRCLLALREQGPVTGYLKGSTERFPAYVFRENGAIFVNILVPKTSQEDQKKLMFLKNYDALEKKDYFVITQRINNLPQLRASRELFEVPSVVLNSVYFEGDMLYMDFRFHRNFAQDVSRLLSKFSENFEDTRVVDLGPSQGLTGILDSMNRTIPLSVVKYMVPNQGSDSGLKKVMIDDRFLAEVEQTKFSDDGHTYLLYAPSEITIKGDDIREISYDDCIYEARDFNPYLLEVSKIANENKIPRYSLFTRRIGENIETLIFLPESQREEYSRLLFELARKFFDNPPVLTVSRRYSADLWEFL